MTWCGAADGWKEEESLLQCAPSNSNHFVFRSINISKRFQKNKDQVTLKNKTKGTRQSEKTLMDEDREREEGIKTFVGA